jgi:uncharacterized DUF497 family protein
VEFEWDPAKRAANLAKHGLDFRDARYVFDGRAHMTFISPRGAEARWVTVGLINGEFVSVVWVDRSAARRIISMRRARRAEEREYRQIHG